jgi:oligopeptide/dipeptide ABC transporter ATP-binding protein
LLSIEDLSIEFRSGNAPVRGVEGLSLQVGFGEALCLVGESGCGKTVTALAVTRLLPVPPAHYAGGRILLNGLDVLRLSAPELREIRGGMVSYIFQEPAASLNPVIRLGAQIKEALRLHRPAAATDAEVVRLLKLVGIPAPELRCRDYPYQVSGGMQQRVMIAMAIASEPKLLVADEPTTALDVTIQAQILELLSDLRRRLGMSLVLITHNLALMAGWADRVAVMYAGQIVECAAAAELVCSPLHPYTLALLESVPQLGRKVERLPTIPGGVPAPGQLPDGCRFHPRCPRAGTACREHRPELAEVKAAHWVRCPEWKDTAPPASLMSTEPT